MSLLLCLQLKLLSKGNKTPCAESFKGCLASLELRKNTNYSDSNMTFHIIHYYSIFSKTFRTDLLYVSFKIQLEVGLSPTHINTASGEIPQISRSETLIQKGLGPSTQRSANQNLSYIKVFLCFATREVILGFTTQNIVD